jgi:hypothetical protein
MSKRETGKSWRETSEEILVGMTEWRQQNLKATFRAIEEELDQRLDGLRARMLADLAVGSATAEWEARAEGPRCSNCGVILQPNGKKKRKLQTRGGREVELEREYGICPQRGQGIFPPG